VLEEALVLVLKGLNGGLFVVVFALVAETLMPKRFAGLFAAAPSIAIANLLVVAIADGDSEAHASADGMLIGAGAMSAGCLAGTLFLRHANAVRSSGAVCVVWLFVAVIAYLMLEV
jgi:hypothetical protein